MVRTKTWESGRLSNTKVSNLMMGNVVTSLPEETLSKVIAKMSNLALHEIPVVDKKGKIASSVRIEDISRSMWYEREGENSGDVIGEKDKPEIEVKAFCPSSSCGEKG